MRELVVVPDVPTLSRDMADRFVRLAGDIIPAKGRLSFCLSGGSTPKSLYALLASDQYRTKVDWSRVHFFWGDERTVPPDHPDSNYRMAHEALISKLPDLPAGNVHRMPADDADLAAGARRYEDELKAWFSHPTWPVFDIMLLGMGPDGHTASLFPDSPALEEKTRWVVPNHVVKLDTWRMTLTFPVIDNSQWIFFLVGGADKAEVLHEVVEGQGEPRYPSQRVQPTHGRSIWLIEKAAAARLTSVKA